MPDGSTSRVLPPVNSDWRTKGDVPMYNVHSALPLASTGAAAGSLPFTGFGVLWMTLAAVALIALGGAIRRLVPARQA